MFLITTLLLCLLIFAVNAVNLWRINRKINEFARNYSEFVTPETEGEKSGLDNFIETLSYNIGHSAFTQVRSMLASSESADVRAKKAVDSAVSEDLLAAANPVLAGLLDSMPQLRKIIRRNPALADYAIDKIMSRAQSGSTVEASSNGDPSTKLTI